MRLLPLLSLFLLAGCTTLSLDRTKDGKGGSQTHARFTSLNGESAAQLVQDVQSSPLVGAVLTGVGSLVGGGSLIGWLSSRSRKQADAAFEEGVLHGRASAGGPKA